jgi:hypothetical protein
VTWSEVDITSICYYKGLVSVVDGKEEKVFEQKVLGVNNGAWMQPSGPCPWWLQHGARWR